MLILQKPSAKTGAVVKTRQGKDITIKRMDWSPDGSTLALASEGGGELMKAIWIWDLNTDRAWDLFFERDHRWLWNVRWYSDGKKVLGIYLTGEMQAWNIDDGTPLLPDDKSGTCNCIRTAGFSPDGKTWITAGDERVFRVYDAETAQEIRAFGIPVPELRSLAVSEDGRRAATECRDGYVRVWDLASEKLLTLIPFDGEFLAGMAFCPNGQTVCTVECNGRLRRWTGSDATFTAFLERASNERDDEVACAAITPDGRHIVYCRRKGTVQFWNIENQRVEWSFPDQVHEWDMCLAFSPDGQTLVVTGGGFVRLLDATTGAVKHIFEKVYPVSVSFSSDGRRVAIGEIGYRVIVWDVATGECCGKFQAVRDSVDVSLSPDGTQSLVTTSYFPEAWVHDVSTGKQLRTLNGHVGSTRGSAFLSAKRGLTIAEDGTLRQWDLTTGHPLSILQAWPVDSPTSTA